MYQPTNSFSFFFNYIKIIYYDCIRVHHVFSSSLICKIKLIDIYDEPNKTEPNLKSFLTMKTKELCNCELQLSSCYYGAQNDPGYSNKSDRGVLGFYVRFSYPVCLFLDHLVVSKCYLFGIFLCTKVVIKNEINFKISKANKFLEYWFQFDMQSVQVRTAPSLEWCIFLNTNIIKLRNLLIYLKHI